MDNQINRRTSKKKKLERKCFLSSLLRFLVKDIKKVQQLQLPVDISDITSTRFQRLYSSDKSTSFNVMILKIYLK